MKTYPKELQAIKDDIETLHGVELLEYHNKNWLSGDNATRCKARIDILDGLRKRVDSFIAKYGDKI